MRKIRATRAIYFCFHLEFLDGGQIYGSTLLHKIDWWLTKLPRTVFKLSKIQVKSICHVVFKKVLVTSLRSSINCSLVYRLSSHYALCDPLYRYNSYYLCLAHFSVWFPEPKNVRISWPNTSLVRSLFCGPLILLRFSFWSSYKTWQIYKKKLLKAFSLNVLLLCWDVFFINNRFKCT